MWRNGGEHSPPSNVATAPPVAVRRPPDGAARQLFSDPAHLVNSLDHVCYSHLHVYIYASPLPPYQLALWESTARFSLATRGVMLQ